MPQSEYDAHRRGHVRAFKLRERRIWPGCIEIEIEGELDQAVSGRFQAVLEAAEATPCHVLVNFGACEFIDSSGLEVLAAASRSIAARGRQLLLYGVHGQARQMLSVTGLDQNGVRIAAGDAAALCGSGEIAFDRSFDPTVTTGEPRRLRPVGVGAP